MTKRGMILRLNYVKKIDPDIAANITKEYERQKSTLELIAAENITSPAVMEIQGSILTNKYAEGYPDRRYYGGCEFVDVAEKFAIDRAKKLFSAEYANVQPHSGSQANMAIYFAFLKPGDTVLGMNLSHGGHLTHGSPVSFSGKLFNFIHYGVKKETGIIDYEEVARLADKHKPAMIVAGASAYPRIIDFGKFSQIARQFDAYLMVDMAHIAGLVAAGVHPSPIPFADVVSSTTHKTLRGPRGGLILARSKYSKRLNSEVFPGMQGGPFMHVIAAKALAFKEAFSETFVQYQNDVVKNAKALAEYMVETGINLVSGGTDNHMVLLDLRNLDITGKDAAAVLETAGITVNQNSIPFEKLSPQITSGIRIGTPAVTTRGMKVPEMEIIARLIVDILKNPGDKKLIEKTRATVNELCTTFPLYKEYEF